MQAQYTSPNGTQYISCAETAKLIRAALRKSFPSIKFGVTSKTYSGGASIRVSWVDGPTEKEVQSITSVYEAKSFDGMIDMACSNYAYMLPDGSVQFADSPGTEGSRGTIPAMRNPTPIRSQRIHFGSDYVHTDRRYSCAFLTRIAEAECRKFGQPMVEIKESSYGAWVERAGLNPLSPCNYDTMADLVNRAAHSASA